MTHKNTVVKHASEFYAEYDEHGDICKESKRQFDKNGFLTFAPGFIEEKVLNEFLFESNKSLLNWDDGEVDLSQGSPADQSKFVNSHKANGVNYWGCPLQHRVTRGFGSLFPEENTNWLLGKRATIATNNWNKKMASIVENIRMQSAAKSLLNANELSFHNGSVARTYPGSTGESRSLHVDTSGFTSDPLDTIKNNRYVVNMFTYLSDVTEDLSPIRFVPGSHNEHLKINEYICKNNNMAGNVYMMARHSNIYEEMLPDYLEPPVKIVGDKGTMIAFHNGLLHSTSANNSGSEHRTALICNYANRAHEEIFKESYLKGHEKFASYINDKELIQKSFLGGGQRLFVPYLKRTVRNSVLTTYSKFRAKIAIVSQLRHSIKNSLSPVDKRKYLNVGAGQNWTHPLFVSADKQPGTNVAIDLSKPVPLPFEDKQFLNIYTSHFLEHLKYSESQYLLKDLHRCLSEGGLLRLIVPNLEAWLEAYENKNSSFFNYSTRGEIYPQESWLRLIVRQFAEPVVDKYSDEEIYDLYNTLNKEEFLEYFESKVNEESDERLLGPNTHKAWYGEEKLKSLLLASGFKDVVRVSSKESSNKFFTDNYKNFDGVKPGRNLNSIFMEATKA